MKKLQLFALLMLLSTGYIAQAGQGRPGRPNGQQGGQQGNQGRQGGQQGGRGRMSKEQVATELGGSVSFESVSNYAKSYAEAISKLSASSTPEDFKAVMDKGGVMQSALMQLAPKPGNGGQQPNSPDVNQNETSGAQLPQGGQSISGGPIIENMPADLQA